MYGENPVGKKVNLLKSVGSCTRQMTDEVCEVVSVVPWSKELNDWCQHYIVRGADGTEKEIREVECVFSPDNELPEERRISDFLYKNGVYAGVWHYMGTTAIVVSGDGDWKHFHIWLRTLMEYLGYQQIAEKVTEEDGSDWYGSEHYFLKTA